MRIAFLGDSLTEGWPGAAFLPLLQRRFPQHELLNLGRAGDCVADLLRRLPYQDPGRVDLVVLWIGANDAVSAATNAWGDAEAWSWDARAARAVDDYGELLAWSAERAPATVCVRPLVLEAGGSVWEDHADGLGDAMEGRALAQPGSRVVDLRPAFAAAAAAGRGPFTIDGVHFTQAGAEVVAASLAAEVGLAEMEQVGARPEAVRPLEAGEGMPAREHDAPSAEAGREEEAP
jgi:lysophospholipase L1-like esterase